MDLSIDPTNPEPGGSTTLTVTVSGQQGVNRFGVPGVAVALILSEEPGSDASISPASVTTDSSGTATAQMRLSSKRGRHVVGASAGSLTATLSVDTALAGSDQPTRAHHKGELDPLPAPASGRVSPLPLFGAAALFLLAGFVMPYVPRVRRALLPGRGATAAAAAGARPRPVAQGPPLRPAAKAETRVVEPELFTVPALMPAETRLTPARPTRKAATPPVRSSPLTTTPGKAPAPPPTARTRATRGKAGGKAELRPAQPRKPGAGAPAKRPRRPDVRWTT